MKLHESKFWQIIGLIIFVIGASSFRSLPKYWHYIGLCVLLLGAQLWFGYEKPYTTQDK